MSGKHFFITLGLWVTGCADNGLVERPACAWSSRVDLAPDTVMPNGLSATDTIAAVQSDATHGANFGTDFADNFTWTVTANGQAEEVNFLGGSGCPAGDHAEIPVTIGLETTTGVSGLGEGALRVPVDSVDLWMSLRLELSGWGGTAYEVLAMQESCISSNVPSQLSLSVTPGELGEPPFSGGRLSGIYPDADGTCSESISEWVRTE